MERYCIAGMNRMIKSPWPSRNLSWMGVLLIQLQGNGAETNSYVDRTKAFYLKPDLLGFF